MQIPVIRPSVKQFTLIGFWVVFLSAYFTHYPLPEPFSRLYWLGLAVMTTASAAGYGSWIASRLMPQASGSGERLIFSLGLGWLAVSLFMMGLGAVQAWSRAGAIAVIAGGLAIGWKTFHWPASWTSGMVDRARRLPRLPAVLLALSTGISIVMAFAPITYYDSLVYHLALPQAYRQAGGWVGWPDLIYSAFPQNMEMLWLLGLLLAQDPLVNLLGVSIAASLLGAVHAFGMRYVGRDSAWAGTALMAIMPAYLLLSSGGYVDLGLTFFSFLSFFAVCLWRDVPDRKTAALAGLLAGAAVGVKYTGGIPAVIGFLLIAFRGHRSTWRANLPHLLVYGASCFLVFLPWMIKNLTYVGNPVFPFFYRWSLAHLNPWVGDAAAGYFRGLAEYEPRPLGILGQLLWDIAMRGLEFGGGMDALGNFGWALLIVLLPGLWLCASRPPVLRLLGLYAVLFYIPWALTRPVLRFFIPAAPVVALLAGFAWSMGIEQAPAPFRRVGRSMAALMALSGLLIFGLIAQVTGLLQVPLGFQDRRSYLTHTIPYYAAARFVNTLPDNVLVYVVGDQRSYYYHRPVIVTPVFNRNPLADWANQASSAESLRERLRAHEVTHLLVVRTEFERLSRSYSIFPLDEQGRRNWRGLMERLARRVYVDAQAEVFEL